MEATIDVLGACERLWVMVVEPAMEELTLDRLGTIAKGSVEHTAGAGKEGKTTPSIRGSIKILSAFLAVYGPINWAILAVYGPRNK